MQERTPPTSRRRPLRSRRGHRDRSGDAAGLGSGAAADPARKLPDSLFGPGLRRRILDAAGSSALLDFRGQRPDGDDGAKELVAFAAWGHPAASAGRK